MRPSTTVWRLAWGPFKLVLSGMVTSRRGVGLDETVLEVSGNIHQLRPRGATIGLDCGQTRRRADDRFLDRCTSRRLGDKR